MDLRVVISPINYILLSAPLFVKYAFPLMPQLMVIKQSYSHAIWLKKKPSIAKDMTLSNLIPKSHVLFTTHPLILCLKTTKLKPPFFFFFGVCVSVCVILSLIWQRIYYDSICSKVGSLHESTLIYYMYGPCFIFFFPNETSFFFHLPLLWLWLSWL